MQKDLSDCEESVLMAASVSRSQDGRCTTLEAGAGATGKLARGEVAASILESSISISNSLRLCCVNATQRVDVECVSQ